MATTIYEAIRSSLIALLKGRWPAFDVFGEGIDKTQEAGQTELEDYIYLDIIPSGNQPAGRGYTDRSILVDAAIHTKGESNLEYLQISQELDDLLRPVFRFTDKGEARAVTIPDLAFNIVDIVSKRGERLRRQSPRLCIVFGPPLPDAGRTCRARSRS